MNENVIKFFERYDADEALRSRVAEAEANYPGSLEIREALCEAVLLPIAQEIGLPFTLDDKWLAEPDDGGDSYWLLDRGWSDDEAKFCGDK